MVRRSKKTKPSAGQQTIGDLFKKHQDGPVDEQGTPPAATAAADADAEADHRAEVEAMENDEDHMEEGDDSGDDAGGAGLPLPSDQPHQR